MLQVVGFLLKIAAFGRSVTQPLTLLEWVVSQVSSLHYWPGDYSLRSQIAHVSFHKTLGVYIPCQNFSLGCGFFRLLLSDLLTQSEVFTL